MKAFVGLMFITFSFALTDGWILFERVKFTRKYSQLYGQYFEKAEFDSEINAWKGKEVTLEGYYVPTGLPDDKAVILSRYPFASCFFCGGAGPESVAEIVFAGKKPNLEIDDLVTVKGKLKLNNTDEWRMTFILEDATIIKD